jgi:hypothetical protein
MTGWLEYGYLIVSRPDEHPCPSLPSQITRRIEMSPRSQWLIMSGADAMLIVLNGATGLLLTDHPNRYGFNGNRPDFDDWMSAHHPEIAYRWLDQWVVAFADRAAQLSFNDDLGERVLRSMHLPRSVC